MDTSFFQLTEEQKVEGFSRAVERIMERALMGGGPDVRVLPRSINFGRCPIDRVSPPSYEGMKTADAVEVILKQTGRPMTKHELIEKLQAGGCKITGNPELAYRVLSITIGSNAAGCNLAKRPRFTEEGNMVGLVEWQDRTAS